MASRSSGLAWRKSALGGRRRHERAAGACGIGSVRSQRADTAKQTAQSSSKPRSPRVCSKTLPSRGPSSSSMVSTSWMTALPRASVAPSSSRGRLACTAGWYSPSTAYSRQSAASTSGVTGTPSIAAAAAAMPMADTVSSTAMIFCLRQRSASTPPASVPSSIGTRASAVTLPYSAAESVRRRRYNGSANRSAALPNSVMIWQTVIL